MGGYRRFRAGADTPRAGPHRGRTTHHRLGEGRLRAHHDRRGRWRADGGGSTISRPRGSRAGRRRDIESNGSADGMSAADVRQQEGRPRAPSPRDGAARSRRGAPPNRPAYALLRRGQQRSRHGRSSGGHSGTGEGLASDLREAEERRSEGYGPAFKIQRSASTSPLTRCGSGTRRVCAVLRNGTA